MDVRVLARHCLSLGPRCPQASGRLFTQSTPENESECQVAEVGSLSGQVVCPHSSEVYAYIQGWAPRHSGCASLNQHDTLRRAVTAVCVPDLCCSRPTGAHGVERSPYVMTPLLHGSGLSVINMTVYRSTLLSCSTSFITRDTDAVCLPRQRPAHTASVLNPAGRWLRVAVMKRSVTHH